MNPELQRNLWLEASPGRLAWLAVVLLILYGATLVVGGPPTASGAAPELAFVGMAVFCVTALIWGSRAAGRSIGNELLQKTWDFQRLSALTPLQMLVGKLAGSTSMAWLAALSGLIVFNFGMAALGLGSKAAQWTLIGVGAAVLLQAGALAMALVGVRRARADGRPPNLRIGFSTAVGFVVMLNVMSRTSPNSAMGRGDLLPGLGRDLPWWGIEHPGAWFAGLSFTAFAAWAVVAAWRLMRLELQMQNRPWAWPTFLVFAAVYFAGFFWDVGAAYRWAAAGAVFGLGAYAAAFAEPADRVRLRRWAEAVGQRDLRRAAMTVPAAYVALKLAAVAAIGLMLSAPDLDLRRPAGLALAALAFLVRDVGVIAYFRFGPRTRRGDFGAVLGLFLLYFVGGLVGRSLGGPAGLALFTPSPGHAWLSAASGAVMAAIAWALAWRRIRAPEAAGD